MGRVKGKGINKLTASNHEESGSGEEEKVPTQKRRGRPQKPLKDEIPKMEVQDNKNKDSSIMTTVENCKKRRRNTPTKEKQTPMKEEKNDVEESLIAEVSIKPNGFRHIGSRRKNKPRRAAEVGVECFCNC